MEIILTDEQLIAILTEASSAYYNTDTKIISDEEFDDREIEYQKRFGKKFIGALPKSGKGTINVSHKYGGLVGTLSKNKTVDEFMEWYIKTSEKLSAAFKIPHFPSLYADLKYDGNSIVVEYDKDGNVTKVLTRGKNGKGLDLTHVFKNYHQLENINAACGIKYEVVMTYDDFNKLMKDENISYANPRSIVAGKLGCDDAVKYSDYFTLIPLWIKLDGKDLTKEEELDLLLLEFGEEYEDYVRDYAVKIEGESYDKIRAAVELYYTNIIKLRADLPFMIDGLVFETIDENDRKVLGMNTGYPNWGTALKFPYMEKSSKVVAFDYCLGDTGRITPRAWFTSVNFNGTIHQKQSLQNYARYKELNLSIGSDILVSYNNDCLSYIERANTENNAALDKIKKEEIVTCPVCNSIAVINDNKTFFLCPNNLCPGKTIGKIQNYLVKMDIKGIKENTITSLNNAGLLNVIQDLYNMDYDKIQNIEGLGEKTGKIIKQTMADKIPYDYEILASLGIANCSRSTSKEICRIYTLQEILDMDNVEKGDALLSIDGIADITAAYIIMGIAKDIDIITFLLNRKHIIYKDEINNIAAEEPETIVFTGFRDKKLQAKLERLGHKVTSSTSKNTTLVVTVDINGTSSKLVKARDLNIPIVTPEECKTKFNID